ncbi:hypothetical protein [uncultured Kriegella sp.]|uniref:hypothetical protein n=1 Tax=uncultured Kriegella sp. TaxID=1798910 RepID=UPI0030DCC6D8
MGNCLVLGAQTHSTKETKVILVVNINTKTTTHIVLFNSFEKLKRQQVESAFPNSRFYIGLLRGNYTLNDYGLKPEKDTEVVIYTNRQVFQEEPFLAGEEVGLGDKIKLGNKTARIISRKKGEIMLKTY